MISKKLHSISARQLYQHCKYNMQMRKQTIGMSELSFEELKKLTGKQNVDVNYSIYNRDILKKDADSINRKTDINLEYEKKRGAETIVFAFKKKESDPTLFDNLEEVKDLEEKPIKSSSQSLTLEQQEVNDFFIKYKIDTKIRKEFFGNYTCKRIKDNIQYAEEAFKVKQKSPTFSYIIKAIREDYAKSDETAFMEEKNQEIWDLWSIVFSYEGPNKEAKFMYHHKYIGTTIHLYKQISRATEEDFKSYYKFKEVGEKFQSLKDFQEAVKEHTREEFKDIENKLSNMQNKYNLSLDDVCKIRSFTKEDLFKKMGVSEEEFKKLKKSLCE